ncbi:MAG: DUF4292 domain-containing protein [Bacteroidota bacterium]|nr:DUF4292 domain-containing protein [Bacteroidota bacterium]MDQ6889011.1 DUF4292 domain-containing protein [Bacteroidota bacterium]
MIRQLFIIFFGAILLHAASGCRSTKKLQTAVNKKDTLLTVNTATAKNDSIKGAADYLNALQKNRINFTTFTSKIKVQYEDTKGKQPDFNAFVRLYSDSVLWVSISATFLGIEAFKILITKDSIIILNKLDKQVEYHPFSYIEQITHIPLNFSTMQDLLIGNPIYVGDSIVNYRQTENHILIATAGKFFKNLITISADNKLIERSKLDDIDLSQNRTADLTYGDYEKNNDIFFSTYREITVAEKTKVDINLLFKQYEFNKELSFPFIIPRNYKTK